MNFAARLSRLRSLTPHPVLVTDPQDVFYYSGYQSGVDDHPLLFVPTSGKPSILLSPLAPKVEAYASPITDQKEFLRLLPKHIGIDERHLSFAGVQELQKTHTVVGVSALIKKPREIKDADEIALMRKAIAIDAEVIRSVRLTGTEQDIAHQISLAFHEKRASEAYETIVASGGNAGSYIHHIPGTRKVSAKDSVIIDFGSKWKGYSSDITRTYVDRKNKKQLQMFDVVHRIQQECIDLVRPGVAFKDIQEHHKKALERAGFSAKHGIGHGIGIFVHEPATILEKGMVITIEPGIYVPGVMGCRIEDMVLVKAQPEVLSKHIPVQPFG